MLLPVIASAWHSARMKTLRRALDLGISSSFPLVSENHYLNAIPAKAGTQASAGEPAARWVPAFAGKTKNGDCAPVIPPISHSAARPLEGLLDQHLVDEA